MQNRTHNEDLNRQIDRQKSKSSLSLLWEEIWGGPLDLQSYVENCWNNIEVNINVDDERNNDSDKCIKQNFKDSGNSSLNDEETPNILDNISYSSHLTRNKVQERGLGNKWALVLKELIETETSYFSSLKEIEEGYLYQLEMRYRLTSGDLKTIFSNWRDLKKFHFTLLTELHSSVAYGFQGLEQIAKCFLVFGQQFEVLYTEYCTNYIKSVKHLNNLEATKSIIWDYLNQCQEELGHQLPLSTFLLKPVQRILKYQLILQELLQSCKLINRKGATYNIEKNILSALETMVMVAERINQKQLEEEQRSHMQQLAEEIGKQLNKSSTREDFVSGTASSNGNREGSVGDERIQLGKVCYVSEMRSIGVGGGGGGSAVGSGSKGLRTVVLCEAGLIVAKRIGGSGINGGNNSNNSCSNSNNNCNTINGSCNSCGVWDIKQFVECGSMKLCESVHKQPLGFQVIDEKRPNVKVGLQASDKDTKDKWCTKIKQLILDTYKDNIISERNKKILLESKQNVLSMTAAESKTPLCIRMADCDEADESADEDPDDFKSKNEDEELNLESSLRKLIEEQKLSDFNKTLTTSINRDATTNNLGCGKHKFDNSNNFQDPSIYQKPELRSGIRNNSLLRERLLKLKDSGGMENRSGDSNKLNNEGDCVFNFDNLDCRSVIADVNEEILQDVIAQAGANESSEAVQQMYVRYTEMCKKKAEQNKVYTSCGLSVNTKELKMDKANNQTEQTGVSEIEFLSVLGSLSDEDSVDSEPISTPQSNSSVKKKTASMDRLQGQLVAHAFSSSSNSSHSKSKGQSFGNFNEKWSIFSGVRGSIKNFRSNSEWATTSTFSTGTTGGSGQNPNIHDEIRPGIVKSISRLFRVPSRTFKKDNQNRSKHQPLPNSSGYAFPDTNSNTINKSTSIDHINSNFRTTISSADSTTPRKLKGPAPPVPSIITKYYHQQQHSCPEKPPRNRNVSSVSPNNCKNENTNSSKNRMRSSSPNNKIEVQSTTFSNSSPDDVTNKSSVPVKQLRIIFQPSR